MSTPTKAKVWRKDGVDGVEQYDLPKWDRSGNEVETPKPKPIQATEDEVDEEVIKAPTVKELESIREDAYNEGFEQGYQQGQAEGKREGLVIGQKEGQQQGHEVGFAKGQEEGNAKALAEQAKVSAEKLAVLDTLANKLATQIEAERTELESALLALSVRIARQVIQDELRAAPEHIHAIVHAAVQSLPNPDEKLSVLVHPDDIEQVERIADSHWQVIAKDTISRGGCEVKSGFSFVEYTLEHRFDTAVSQLLTHLDGVDAGSVSKPFSDSDLLNNQNVASPAAEPLEVLEDHLPEVAIEAAIARHDVVSEPESEVSTGDSEASPELASGADELSFTEATEAIAEPIDSPPEAELQVPADLDVGVVSESEISPDDELVSQESTEQPQSLPLEDEDDDSEVPV